MILIMIEDDPSSTPTATTRAFGDFVRRKIEEDRGIKVSVQLGGRTSVTALDYLGHLVPDVEEHILEAMPRWWDEFEAGRVGA